MQFLRPFRPRGWVLLGAAALAFLLAWSLGRRDLLVLAVFCAALPAVACAGLYGFKSGFTVRRLISPRLARVGEPVSVVLEVRGHGPAGTRTALTEELPPSFHDNPHFSHPHPVVPHGLLSRYQYRALPTQRGVVQVGPLRGLFADPFDVAFLRRALDGGDQLTVAPAAVELPAIPLSDGRGQDGTRSTAELAHASHDDAMTREYRPGDPLRRVHWPVTARQGKLMVRAEESVTAPEAAMVLDQRRLAFGEASRFAFHTPFPTGHAPGTPAAQPMRTTAAFEKAVVAAVSIATHLLERGYAVRVLDHRGRPGFASSPSALDPAVEDFSGPQGVFEVAAALAALELADAADDAGGPGAADAPAPAEAAPGAGTPPPGSPRPSAFGESLAEKLHHGRRRGPLVAVSGMLSAAEARQLAGIAESTQSAYAILVCYEPAEAAAALEILRRAGWHAAALTPKTPLEDAWAELGRTRTAGVAR